jgi:two-component system, chemotaxis family, response regulator Rcp1
MREPKILLVEDNEGDILLTMEAFRQASITGDIDVVRNGEDAIHYLNKNNPFTEAETPDLIFLDINLPKVDGKEVLQHIKTSPALLKIPVVMLTTSESQDDIEECYKKGVNCYISKPADLRIFFDVIKMIRDFWITTVKLPNTKTNG